MKKKKLEPTGVENDNLKENATATVPAKIVSYISPSTSKRKKIWVFLNSSIFIWFLSSVIVVGVTNWFNDMKVSNESKIKNLETTKQLENEISYRIFYSIRYLVLRKVGEDTSIPAKNIYLDTYNILDNHTYSKTNGGLNYALYEEYFERPFASLLFELKSIDTSLDKEIENAFIGFNKFDDIIALKRFEKQTAKEAVDTSLEIIQKNLLGKIWTRYFVDDPFKTK